MPVTPRTPPGVLELLPAQQLAFQHMLDTIRRGFERFGFVPVETPAFELTDVLLTKSGGETEKQVYFVESTGSLAKKGDGLPELALRFDLTVPLARYVAEHESQLAFPFRRYQIQRVYRGERNQKGRYREFYQCDIDVIGKDTLPLAYDAEIPAIIYGIFRELKFGAFTIYVNHRKLLRSILLAHGVPAEQHAPVLHEIDRLGKQDRGEIEQRLAPLVAEPTRLLDLLTAPEPLAALKGLGPLEGFAELEEVYRGTLALGVPATACKINLAIVRGLDYYTGAVYETFLDEHPRLGSICSGGRYDNLAEHYTKSKLPGVGISIGATRLFAQLLDMKIITGEASTHLIVLRADPKLAKDYAEFARELRQLWNVEVYGADDKLGKQLKYANRASIPIALIYGQQEAQKGLVKLKDLRVTDVNVPNETEVTRGELVTKVRELLGHGPAPR
jgi:histidyl-tRNA synthetase